MDYNLGRGAPVNLLEAIRLLEEALGIKAELDLQPMQPGDMRETFADVSRARAALGYEPKIDLRVGIGRFVDWYRSWCAEREQLVGEAASR